MNSGTPDGLGGTPTGPGLGALLAPIELSSVPDSALLEVLSAEWRQLSYQQGRVWAAMSEIAHRDPTAGVPGAVRWTAQQVFDSGVEEVRAELRLTSRGAGAEVARAAAVMALPPVARALTAGEIDRGRAIVLAEACADLTDEQSTVLLDTVLPTASEVTASGLGERVRRVAIALDPGWAERRYREALKDRRVVTYLDDDGTATVAGQHLPAGQAATACARVNALAQAAKRAGAGAKIDHLRAEVFLALLDGRYQDKTETEIVADLLATFPKPDREQDTPPAVAATVRPSAPEVRDGVELRVGLGTLLGLDDQPGELAGLGPVPASVAREVAEQQRRGEWRFAILDPHGRLLFDGATRHRPSGRATGPRVCGGIVELQIPVGLLDDPSLSERFPVWARLLTDIAAQHGQQAPIEQDPTARFPGRPLRRHSQIRHRTCLFPGCRRPAAACEQDHRHDHALGGSTAAQNLGPDCTHDHDLKTKRGWRLAKRDQTTYVWISPLGRRHAVEIQPVAPPLPPPRPRPPNG